MASCRSATVACKQHQITISVTLWRVKITELYSNRPHKQQNAKKKSKYTNLQLKSRHERSEPNPFEKEKEKHKTTYGFAKLKASLDEFAAATSGDDDLHLSSFLSFKIYNEKYEMGSAIYLWSLEDDRNVAINRVGLWLG